MTGRVAPAVEVCAPDSEQPQILLRWHAGLIEVGGGLVKGQGKITKFGRELSRLGLGEGRCPAAEQDDGVRPVERVQIENAAQSAKTATPGRDQHMPGSARQQRADFLSGLGVVEDQQPAAPGAERVLDRSQGGAGVRQQRHAQLGGKASELVADRRSMLRVEPPHQRRSHRHTGRHTRSRSASCRPRPSHERRAPSPPGGPPARYGGGRVRPPGPVKFGLRGGRFHTPGKVPGNRGSVSTARASGGKPGSRAGLARPVTAAAVAARSRARATALVTPNRSTLTTPASRPGRSQSITRTVSSSCFSPSGSSRQAASHSAMAYTEARYAGDKTAIVRPARWTPSCIT